MLASGALRGGYKASTESLSDPVPALTEDWSTLPVPRGSPQLKRRFGEGGKREVATGLDP